MKTFIILTLAALSQADHGVVPFHHGPIHHAPVHHAPIHHAPIHKPIHHVHKAVHHAPIHVPKVHHAPIVHKPVHLPVHKPVHVPVHKPVHHAPVHAPATYDGPAVYNYGYAVKDDYSGVNFGHEEARDGHAAHGNYHVLLPDGRLQTVKYTSDHHAGYVADVTYSGKASYAPAPHHPKA